MGLVRVAFDHLWTALEWVSADPSMEAVAYVSRKTGAICWVSDDLNAADQKVPDDLDDETRHARVPHKWRLGLGSALPMRFVEETFPDAYDDVSGFFRRQGA